MLATWWFAAETTCSRGADSACAGPSHPPPPALKLLWVEWFLKFQFLFVACVCTIGRCILALHHVT